jgi:chorismate lyase / 3-hydroxybenzoate synthase
VYHPRGRASAGALFHTVSQLSVPSVIPEPAATLPPLRIGYSDATAASVLAEPGVLAAIGFGHADSPDDPRFVRIGLEAVGTPLVEVWRSQGTVKSGRGGDVRWSSDGDYALFAIEVAEPGGDDITLAAEHAYREITRAVAASATPHVLRLWNYFDAINVGEGDDERYRRFCVGRVRGMNGFWRETFPAATAIGRRDGVRVLQVYALAARSAGVPVENPRQVNAWRYPREYGPIAPTFARGMSTPAGQFLISGTAAVVGSASRHEDDVGAQLEETLTNIESLVRTADATLLGNGASLLKVYVREPRDAALIETRLREAPGALDGLLILNGDICRRELLVEIDGARL